MTWQELARLVMAQRHVPDSIAERALQRVALKEAGTYAYMREERPLDPLAARYTLAAAAVDWADGYMAGLMDAATLGGTA